MLAFWLIPFSLGMPLISATGGCTGADPALTHAALQTVTRAGALKHYVVEVTVKNVGNRAQPSNLLQSVEVLQNGDHVDQKGLPPLRPGQSATVTYAFDRAASAGARTTRLTFVLSQTVAIPGPQDCSTANDRIRLSV